MDAWTNEWVDGWMLGKGGEFFSVYSIFSPLEGSFGPVNLSVRLRFSSNNEALHLLFFFFLLPKINTSCYL